MAAHVMCLTSGGVPLFVRKKGVGDLMSFSKIASLNGIHMFLKNHNAELLTTDMPDTIVVWKEFKKCIVLIAIANSSTKEIIHKFLDWIFDAMILIVGLQDIEKPRSIERLKKDLRTCYPTIDKLLDCLVIGDRWSSKTDIIDLTECILCSENHLLQICLEGFMERLDSLYGCLLIHNCVSVATDSWWSLDPTERKLLILTTAVENDGNSESLPVFLPYKSPNLAYRLVNIKLISNIQILALCGPNPELNELEKLANQCWRNSIEVLCTSEQCYPKNFPTSISLDSGILGFLLINHKLGKFVMSRNAKHSKINFSGTHHLETLRTFYHHAAGTFLYNCHTDSNKENDKESLNKINMIGAAKETYWCSEYHKCHALKEVDHIFCILYMSSVPTYAMRTMTQKILKIILRDKQVCW